ncbi:riboflavin biosynthesis protein [Steroidobacter agaridevorans]|uniref:Riboflavin biosynthesis protein n=1 Tax=Steroidobacter agaridevorans TaxID=2695856 RepID=A0A829YP94_9GAMM|nr:bifunctional riboflavin kinase/FAD synthetase [Steroidobacter agaridevorans]GFE84633.1 riboflavin biosynthesis protein [Steroidobacter agaridevorans]GFE91034.1 riboflavin biosynthesis protein [Steroidobacter agaridevorans]
MELIRGLYNLRAGQRGCVLTIGAFDGIHVGHQEMIRVLRERAAQHGLPAALMSFEPTPREFFAKGTPPARLTRFREKFEALERYGVDRFVCLRFNERMRRLGREEFVNEVLVKALGVRHIVVGHDFRFGRDNQGDIACLRSLGAAAGFEVTEVPPFEIDGERVSSSGIREALAVGDMAKAAKLLGRPYRMTGKVIHGEKLGRKLGFPTANLRLHRRATPLAGIFAIRVTGAGLKDAPGVASLGTRPAVNGKELLLEAHVFDFEGDLYRQHVHVDFVAYLRAERWFADMDALIEQMNRDAAQARQILGS